MRRHDRRGWRRGWRRGRRRRRRRVHGAGAFGSVVEDGVRRRVRGRGPRFKREAPRVHRAACRLGRRRRGLRAVVVLADVHRVWLLPDVRRRIAVSVHRRPKRSDARFQHGSMREGFREHERGGRGRRRGDQIQRTVRRVASGEHQGAVPERQRGSMEGQLADGRYLVFTEVAPDDDGRGRVAPRVDAPAQGHRPGVRQSRKGRHRGAGGRVAPGRTDGFQSNVKTGDGATIGVTCTSTGRLSRVH